MASNPHPEAISLSEYLMIEQNTGIKHEYIDGQVFAMTGGTARHSKIIHNLGGVLFAKLRGTPCGGFDSNLKVKINETRFVYPDFTVVWGDPVYADERETQLTNPTMVVEVLSDSTERHDRFVKLDLYRTVASIEIYVMIEQTQARAIMYTRQDNGWLLRDFIGLATTIPLDAINTDIVLADVYDTISFDDR